MTDNPFGDIFAEQAVEPAPVQAVTEQPATIETPHVENSADRDTGDESPISFTFKVGGNLFSVRAGTGYGFVAAAKDVLESGAITWAEKLNATAGGTTQAAAPQQSYQARPAAPAYPEQKRVTGHGRMCVHGERLRREGNSAKGQWVGFFCPLPQDRKPEQCSPQFGKPGID